MIERHEQLGAAMPARHHDFPALDRDFHTFLSGSLDNCFANGFFDIVSLVFHYHYQWEKDSEMSRNEYAVHAHLDILRALARSTLLRSIHSRELAHYEIGQPQQ